MAHGGKVLKRGSLVVMRRLGRGFGPPFSVRANALVCIGPTGVLRCLGALKVQYVPHYSTSEQHDSGDAPVELETCTYAIRLGGPCVACGTSKRLKSPQRIGWF